MVRTIVQLREDQAATLKRLARERGTSVAALVREAVDRATGEEQRLWEEKVARARACAGMMSSGLGDLSARHDDYWAEDIYEEHREKR